LFTRLDYATQGKNIGISRKLKKQKQNTIPIRMPSYNSCFQLLDLRRSSPEPKMPITSFFFIQSSKFHFHPIAFQNNAKILQSLFIQLIQLYFLFSNAYISKSEPTISNYLFHFIVTRGWRNSPCFQHQKRNHILAHWHTFMRTQT